jgi:hypothetical protein
MAISKTSIANQALDELAAPRIGDVEESSFEAKVLKPVIDDVIRELLEGDHPWSFQIVRSTLVGKTLDRLGEWTHAYVMPSDVGSILGILPIYDGIVSSTIVWPSVASRPAIPYLWEGQTIYASMEPAQLAYVSTNPQWSRMSAKFARAVALETAVRTCMTIKKSRELKGDLIKQAQVAWERAIADDANKSPESWPDFVTDVEIVRGGGLDLDTLLDAPWRRGH